MGGCPPFRGIDSFGYGLYFCLFCRYGDGGGPAGYTCCQCQLPDFDVLLQPLVLSNLLFLAVLASLICYILWNVVLKQLGTMRASNYIYLNPLVTMVASVLILHEQITWITLMGAACIILGVYLAEKK